MTQVATARGGRPPRIRPEEILDVLATRVDDSWTMGGVARELGVSEAAIYYYFPTKNDLLVAIGRRLFGNLVLPRLQGDAERWLSEVGVCLYDFFLRYPLMTSASVDLLDDGTEDAWPTEPLLADLTSLGFSLADADTVITTIVVLATGYAGMASYLDSPRGTLFKQRVTSRAEQAPDTLTSRGQLLAGAWDVRARFVAALAATVAGLCTLRAPGPRAS